MSDNWQIKWKLKELLVKTQAGQKASLKQVALQIAGRTKVNIQANGFIDTGFMLNSVYARMPQDSGYVSANSEAAAHTYSAKRKRVMHYKNNRMAPEADLKYKDGAAVVVGARYAAWLEAKESFLYRAAEEVVNEVGGSIEATFQKEVND